MRFQRGGAYSSDITALRNQIRTNGTIARLGVINVSHPSAAAPIQLHINLAYEANSNLPPINGSLYTVAFQNGNGIWHFNVGPIGVVLPGNPILGGLDGSYGSLGWQNQLPDITDATLLNAVNAVGVYAGAATNANLLTSLARLIIAVSEAVRFSAVENGINGILGNANTYQPPFNTIHNWGGHSLG